MEFLIIGSFGRVGFQLCRFLLDKGYPVQHVDIFDQWMEEDLEEKRMWVERNANFSDYNQGKPLVENSKILLPSSDWSAIDKPILEKTVIEFLLNQGENEQNFIGFSIIAEDGDQRGEDLYLQLKNNLPKYQLVFYPKDEKATESQQKIDEWSQLVLPSIFTIISSNENGIFHFNDTKANVEKEKEKEKHQA